jgi:large subunit ribosomal protein L2
MVLKFSKPTTPSQRNLVRLNRKQLSKKSLIKTEISGLKNSSGRNFSGKITIRHRGNGHKKKYRKINFSRTIKSTGIVVNIEYDPNRNSNIAAIYDFTKNFFFLHTSTKKT